MGAFASFLVSYVFLFKFFFGTAMFESRSEEKGILVNWILWECVTGVRSCYDEGKRTAETLTMDYHRGAGVEVTNNH